MDYFDQKKRETMRREADAAEHFDWEVRRKALDILTVQFRVNYFDADENAHCTSEGGREYIIPSYAWYEIVTLEMELIATQMAMKHSQKRYEDEQRRSSVFLDANFKNKVNLSEAITLLERGVDVLKFDPNITPEPIEDWKENADRFIKKFQP